MTHAGRPDGFKLDDLAEHSQGAYWWLLADRGIEPILGRLNWRRVAAQGSIRPRSTDGAFQHCQLSVAAASDARLDAVPVDGVPTSVVGFARSSMQPFTLPKYARLEGNGHACHRQVHRRRARTAIASPHSP